MKSMKIIGIVSLAFTLNLIAGNRAQVKRGTKFVHEADEMMNDLLTKKGAELHTPSFEQALEDNAPLNHYEIQQSQFLQAVKKIDQGLLTLKKYTEDITTEEDREARFRSERFIGNALRVIDQLAQKVDRRDLAVAIESTIAQYREYANAFVNSRIQEFEQEAQAVFVEDSAMETVNPTP